MRSAAGSGLYPFGLVHPSHCYLSQFEWIAVNVLLIVMQPLCSSFIRLYIYMRRNHLHLTSTFATPAIRPKTLVKNQILVGRNSSWGSMSLGKARGYGLVAVKDGQAERKVSSYACLHTKRRAGRQVDRE